MPHSDSVFFAIPSNINTLTGGYIYDRQIIAGLRNCGIKVEHLPLSAEFPFPSTSVLEKTADLFSKLPDNSIVIADGLAFGAMADIAELEARRLRIIALCHHPLALETGLDKIRADMLQRSEVRALAAAQAVIVTSSATRDLLVREFQVAEQKILLAPPGISASGDSTIPFKTDVQIPTLLTLATLTRRKGHDVLLKALAQIRHLSWRARFVGSRELDADWADWLLEETRRLGLESRVEFVGTVADPEEEFKRADLFVLPSRFEGYGMAFAEALAFGLPIVGAHSGAVPDVVKEDAGILVPPDDHSALARALERLLLDPELRQCMQKGAQKAALALPAWEQSVGKIAELIEAL